MSIPDELRIIRDHLRSGRFGQREVWEQQLEQAAVEIERLVGLQTQSIKEFDYQHTQIEKLKDKIEWLTKEAADYEAEGRRHIKTIAELRHEKERLYINVAERDKKLAQWQHDALGWSDKLTEATDEVERLQGEIDTCRELREYDRLDVERLQKEKADLVDMVVRLKAEIELVSK